MGLPLWCSALVVFDPKKAKICCSVVGLATGEIYTASEDSPPMVHRKPNGPEGYLAEQVHGPSSTQRLRDARVACYGQKAKNFLSLTQSKGFSRTLSELASDPHASFRIYNFGGNPAMIRLSDRPKDASGKIFTRGIDAVFDIAGQRMHDVVPGVFIAKRAGAFLFDLNGAEIGYEQLGQMLMNPTERLKYVLACSKSLGQELVTALND